MIRTAVLCTAAAACLGSAATAQSAKPQSPEALGTVVLERFASGTPAAFDSVYPDADGRRLVAIAAQAEWPRRAIAARVVRASADSAVLMLAGLPETGHSGYETSLGLMFTGLYTAVRDADGWRIAGRLPLDQGNRIRAHAIGATLQPGVGLVIHDTLTVEAASPDGLWLVLNRAARIDSVLVNGRAAQWRHDGSLLWTGIGAPHAPTTTGALAAGVPRPVQLVLAYSLDIGRDSARNGYFARFDPGFGHVRNQHYWLPFFGFGSERGLADFRIEVRAPAATQVVLDLPQHDSVVDDVRVVRAASRRPTSSITLFYDDAWRPTVRRLGALEARLVFDDSVRPSRAAIEAEIERVHRVLSARFGEPQSPSVTIVQGRAQSGYGWIFRSNDLVAGGPRGGDLSRGGTRPSASFGHELAHGWTSPNGPGSTFLSEGWAMYAESLLLAEQYGADTVRTFWERLRTGYLNGGHEGVNSLAGDNFNAGVSYEKGGWLLRMLEDYVGSDAFDRGMRAYMAIPATAPRGTPEFVAAMSTAAGRDLWPFVRPWHEGTTLPRLDWNLEPGRLIVTQAGAPHLMPIDVELVTGAGRVRRSMTLSRAADTLSLRGISGVSDVVLDPDQRLLIHRDRGDTLRVAVALPAANSVELAGTFGARVAAVRGADGRWNVTLPLPAGRYSYAWYADGKYVEAEGVRIVDVPPALRLDRVTSSAPPH